jgi:hypothetical protein
VIETEARSIATPPTENFLAASRNLEQKSLGPGASEVFGLKLHGSTLRSQGAKDQRSLTREPLVRRSLGPEVFGPKVHSGSNKRHGSNCRTSRIRLPDRPRVHAKAVDYSTCKNCPENSDPVFGTSQGCPDQGHFLGLGCVFRSRDYETQMTNIIGPSIREFRLRKR